jgi:Dip2/Utp12 Family
MDETNGDGSSSSSLPTARTRQDDVQVLDAVASSSLKKPRSGVAASASVTTSTTTSSSSDRSSETLFERLQSLQVNDDADAPKKLDIPKAGSIHSVLIQALNTKDQERIDSCLAVTDQHIISETVDRLPTSFVLPFLNVVVDKFRAKPNRAPVLSCWIRQIFVRHTA